MILIRNVIIMIMNMEKDMTVITGTGAVNTAVMTDKKTIKGSYAFPDIRKGIFKE